MSSVLQQEVTCAETVHIKQFDLEACSAAASFKVGNDGALAIGCAAIAINEDEVVSTGPACHDITACATIEPDIAITTTQAICPMAAVQNVAASTVNKRGGHGISDQSLRWIA